MRIYLNGDTPDMSDLVDQVLALLNGVEGPVEFHRVPEPMRALYSPVVRMSRRSVPVLKGGRTSDDDIVESGSWSSHFKRIALLRVDREISRDAYVFDITGLPNNKNWFSFGNEHRNHYIHGEDWDLFTGTEPHFPVAFLVASNTLKSAMFANLDEMLGGLHEKTIGCISDLCIDKREITMKMRTADVCPACMKLLKAGIDQGRIVGADAQHLMRIMDAIRHNLLFRSRFELDKRPSRLAIRGYKQHLFLVDAGDVRVPLNPIQRAIYITLLMHEEGVDPVHLDSRAWIEELSERYARTSGVDDWSRVRETVRGWSDPATFNQHISRIRSAFRNTLGAELAAPYLPVTEVGLRRVPLDRSLVQ